MNRPGTRESAGRTRPESPRARGDFPLLPWLEHLAAHVPLANRDRDPEGVHQLRVAAGRLDTWLRLAGLRVYRDDLRWIRQRASAVRDLDVVLACRGPAAFKRWLRDRRVTERRGLLEALESPRLAALVEGLSLLPKLDRARARSSVAKLADRALRRGEELASDLEVTSFHALRRAARRLRYGLDWLGFDSREVKELQDALGEVNDAAVGLALLDACPQRRQLGAHRRALVSRLRAAQVRVVDDWLTRSVPASSPSRPSRPVRRR